MPRPNQFVVVIALLAVGASASAFTANEPFEYATGVSMAGQNGGSGWSNAWSTIPAGSTTIVATAPGLTYPGILASSNKMEVTPAPTGNATMTRDLLQPFTSNDVFYVGFIAEKTSTNEFSRYFGLALFGITNAGGAVLERALIGQGSGFSNWGVSHVVTGTGTNTLDTGISSTDQSYLLAKIELNPDPTGFETITFWIDPDLSLTEAQNTPVGGTSFLTDNDFGTITRIRIGGGGTGGTPTLPASAHWMDEIMLTTDTPFAIPEPSLFVLLVLGGAVVVGRLTPRPRR